MEIPKTIKVGGFRIKIEIVNLDHPRLDNERRNGCYSTRTETIYIANDIPQSTREVVLIHEILHVINIDIEEVMVEFLARAFYQVIKDNKLWK